MKTKMLILAIASSGYFTVFLQSTTATNTGMVGRFLGYTNNYELLFKTNNINRMKLNGNINYNVDGYAGVRNGNLLLGWQNTGNLYNANFGAYSLLHLNGNGSIVFQAGYRNWMQTGITFTGNNDLSYIGLRQVGTGWDVTETTITWTDNPGPSSGPDDMVFRFAVVGNGNTNISGNLQATNDLDGLHVARFTGSGEFGLGNTFGVNPTGTPANLYVRPASLAHYSLSDLRSVWQQFTNRDQVMNSGTGETEYDGLRIGIVGSTFPAMNGTAAIYNQENTAMLFSTGANTSSMSINNGQTRERMRITSVGTPTALTTGAIGVFNPGNIPANTTRVAISHNPLSPITRPLSLLHLGYNTGLVGINAGTDGWRPWMDIGIFTTNGTDNVYLGLKDENGILGDRQDAVLSWGDNQVQSSPIPSNGPDNFRIIFTSTPTLSGGGTPPATSFDGLEGLRMTPTPNDGIFTGIGGDPQANLYSGNNINPTATLEVNSWGATANQGGSSGLRFTNLNTSSPTMVNPGTGVLSVNSTGDVIYVDAPTTGGGTLGNDCGVAQNPLNNDYEIFLNDHNFFFTPLVSPTASGANMYNNVGIGFPTCGGGLKARIDVLQSGPDAIAGHFTTAFSVPASYTGNSLYIAGLHSEVFGNGNGVGDYHGVSILTKGTEAKEVYGVKSIAEINNTATAGTAYGLYAEVINTSTPQSFGLSYAGYFKGNVHIDGDLTVTGTYPTSDSIFKNNLNAIQNPMQIINALQPKSFYFDTTNAYNIYLPAKKQYGFVAQEVEQILPELVGETNKPTEYDSLGNVITNGITYKNLNYNAFIGIITAAMQEQQQQIESQDSIIDDLNNRLSRLEECLSGILPILCNLNHRSIEKTPEKTQIELIQELEIILQDKTNIVLNQNVPNPFAESTVITYFIPDEIKTAKIIFYDVQGRIINSIDILERGSGRLTVYADDLSSGIYQYTLIADGNVVTTKKMIKQ